MGDYVNKPGFGNLFRNKKQSESQPDFRGAVTTPDGQVFELAGWKKEGAKGSFVSLKIQEPLPRGRSEAEDF